ncbi:MAG: hypothetical protein KDH90_13425, partial [Anaerolineae bacterium]|nr:hypothetical protein [Anaerolineae bacterium]
GDPMADPSADRIPVITPSSLPAIATKLGGSHGVDVTGGMLSKVSEMCRLVVAHPQMAVHLVSGQRAGAIVGALLGTDSGGTRILAD